MISKNKKRIHDFYNRKKRFAREIEHARRLLLGIFAAVGLILFWRGIWDLSREFINPWQAIAIGLGILIFSGMATRLLLTKFNI